MPTPDPRLQLAIDCARQAGELTLSYFQRRSFTTVQKGDGSPVTTADREAEQLLRKLVAGAFPEDGFLGEEFGEQPSRSGYRWIVDPIDGTTSFIHGVPLWGTLIGIEHNGRMIAGVIHMPALDEVVYGAEGGGAWHCMRGSPPQPARVSSVESLKDAMVCITSFDYFTKMNRVEEFHRLSRACRSLRGWSDCYSHVLAATGRIEAVVEPGIHPWDVAAIIPVIREAGGRYTDWDGVETASSRQGVITNGRVHSALLAALRDG